ncbi:Rv3235 family protein [Rhodococcus spongiicola]|uniref:Rv3235 family protein n=1 Tax=Rhodococcus spongiicola TaxID=2487352 RepID=UPI001F44F9FC|nr:Rv3235 family protein [Rhodococcus spongiicola]
MHDDSALHDEKVTPEARRFAELALRLTLEVMDRRRVPAQLRAVAAPAVVDVVQSIARSGHAGNRLGTATLERVRVRPVRSDAAEVFGTYTRGHRVFAIAARIERGNGARLPGWALTSLRIA